MATTGDELRADIVEIGRLVYAKGWVAANDGNLSVRLDDGTVLCTPTAVSKGRMCESDLILCDLNGQKIAGERERTSEIAMHATIYRMRPDVRAVLHAHPPYSTGFAAAGRALNIALLPEAVVSLGSVPLADYGLPGTPALTEGMLPYIGKYDAILMANHGAVSYGADIWQAFHRMETVEHFAKITFIAELVGGAKALPRDEVAKLFEARGRYNVTSHSQMEPGAPVVAEDVQNAAERFELTRGELLAIIEEALRARGVLA